MPDQELGLDDRDLGLHLRVLPSLHGEQLTRERGQAHVRLEAGKQRGHVRDAFGARDAELGSIAADRVGELGAVRISRSRARCSARAACWSGDLIGTKRMVGRVTASQIASASPASVLPRFTYGLTYAGDISRTSWPSSLDLAAPSSGWCRRPPAPTRHGASPAKNGSTWPRRRALRTSTRPVRRLPWTWKTFLIVCSQ